MIKLIIGHVVFFIGLLLLSVALSSPLLIAAIWLLAISVWLIASYCLKKILGGP